MEREVLAEPDLSVINPGNARPAASRLRTGINRAVSGHALGQLGVSTATAAFGVGAESPFVVASLHDNWR